MNASATRTSSGLRARLARLARRPTALVAGSALVLLAGCGPTSVQSTSMVTTGLPRPQRILVYDFAASAI